jgi:hypothetical protein
MPVAQSEIVVRAQALFAAFKGRHWDASFADVDPDSYRFRVGGESRRPDGSRRR